MATIHYPRFTVCRINAAGKRVAVTSATITAYNVTAASSLSSTSSDSDGNVAAGTYTGTVGDIIRFGHATYPGYIYFTSTAAAAEAYTHPDNIECTYVAENLAANLLEGQMVELYATDTDNPDVTPWKIGEGKTGTTVKIPFQSNVAKNLRIFPRTIDSKLGRVRQTFNITTGSQTVAVPATDTIVALDPAAWYSVRRNSVDTAYETYDTRASRPLFEHFVTRTTTSTSEQTLHLYNVARSQFQNNGDTILAEYSGTLAANADEKYLRVYFAGTEIFDSSDIDPALGNNRNWRVRVTVTRKSTSVARCSTDIIVYGWNAFSKYTEVTGLDFPDRLGVGPGTAYDLAFKITTPDLAGDASLTMAEARFVNAVQCDLVTTSLWAYGEARYYKGVGVTQYTDGANITTDWQDLSGNARHAVRTGTPTAELAEINGEAVVRYPGGSVYHTLPDMSALTQGSIFLVWKVTDVTTDAGCRFGTSGSTDHYPYTPDTPDGIYSDFGSTVRKTCGASISTITNYHCTYIWSKSNDWGLHQDGQKIYETTTNTVGFHSSPRIAHNGSAGMKVDLAAWYIFSVKPTDANVAKMYRYIQKEFGC